MRTKSSTPLKEATLWWEGGIPHVYSPVQKLQKMISERIESGNIPIGQEVVQTAFPRYTVQELALENTEV